MSQLKMQNSDNSPEQIDAILKPHVQALRRSLTQVQVPEQLEQELLVRFAQQHRPVPWYKKITETYWQFASAAAVVVLVMSVTLQTSRLGHDAWVSTSAETMTLREDIPFIALGSGEEIAMQDHMRIVQAEVPHTMLASMGISVGADQAGGSSTAEMLFGANDQPLAVRFVPPHLK